MSCESVCIGDVVKYRGDDPHRVLDVQLNPVTDYTDRQYPNGFGKETELSRDQYRWLLGRTDNGWEQLGLPCLEELAFRCGTLQVHTDDTHMGGRSSNHVAINTGGSNPGTRDCRIIVRHQVRGGSHPFHKEPSQADHSAVYAISAENSGNDDEAEGPFVFIPDASFLAFLKQADIPITTAGMRAELRGLFADPYDVYSEHQRRWQAVVSHQQAKYSLLPREAREPLASQFGALPGALVHDHGGNGAIIFNNNHLVHGPLEQDIRGNIQLVGYEFSE